MTVRATKPSRLSGKSSKSYGRHEETASAIRFELVIGRGHMHYRYVGRESIR